MLGIYLNKIAFSMKNYKKNLRNYAIMRIFVMLKCYTFYEKAKIRKIS